MAKTSDILDYLDSELKFSDFSDASLNGLQVAGSDQVRSIAVSVDAGLSVIERAAEIKADLLLVHHGLFWGKPTPIVGARRRALKSLLTANLNLVAIHLPLDAHLTLGNNAVLAKKLELTNIAPAAPYNGKPIGIIADNSSNLNCQQISSNLSQLSGAVAGFVQLKFGPDTPKRICIVTGSGADQLYNFSSENFDTLISGEPKQFAYHFCKENSLNAFFPGHYATETLGVIALAKEIEKKFSVPWTFIDEPTGI